MWRTLFFLLGIFGTVALTAQEAEQSTDYKTGKRLLDLSETFAADRDSFFLLRQQALPYLEKAKAWDEYVNCHNGFSNYFYLNHDFEKFQTSVLKVMDLAEQYLSPTDAAYGFAINNCGMAFAKRGDFRKGQAYYLRALQIALDRGDDKSLLANNYSNLGKNLRRMGDFEEASIHLQKALRLNRDTFGRTHPQTAASTLSLGHVLRDAKKYQEALKHYRIYLAIKKDKTVTSKRSRNDLVYCYQSMVRIFIETAVKDSAQFYLQKVMQLEDEKPSRRATQSYEILGNWHHQNQAYEQAIIAYQQSLAAANIRYKTYEKHVLKAHAFFEMGSTYLAWKNPDAALESFQESLIRLAFDFEAKETTDNPEIENLISLPKGLEATLGKAKAFFLKYELENNLEDLQQALRHYRLAAALVQALRKSFIGENSKQELGKKALWVYGGAIATALALYQMDAKEEYLEEAFSFAEQNKSILLLEALRESNALISGDISEVDLERERQLQIDIAFYQKKIARLKQKQTQNENRKNWEAKLFELRQAYQGLISDFEKQYPNYYALKYQYQIASVADLRKRIIDENTALLEYFIGHEQKYIFCITQNEIQVFPIVWAEDFKQVIVELQHFLAHPPDNKTFNTSCQNFAKTSWEISKTLLQKPLQQLSKEINALIIIPDDVLALVPFETLLLEEAKSPVKDFSVNSFAYLLERFEISYNFSATLLAKTFSTKNRTKKLKPFIAWAPSFNDEKSLAQRSCENDILYTLDCNQQEVTAISTLMGGKTWLGTAADKASFLVEAENYRVVHLATHACSSTDDFTESKIFFADDFLSYRDLQNLNLNAELAVLSACNTGSGELIKGEGVMSLSRGFVLAGCPSTVMSLWSVDDCTTAQLMHDYYQGLEEGLPKDRAMQKAKKSHLSQADKVFSHPYYWAGFVQTGNTFPLQMDTGWTWYYLLGAFLLIGGVFYLLMKKK